MNINNYFKNSSDTMLSIQKQIDSIKEIAKNIYKSQKKGGKLLIAGNGGSSADADHFSCKMIGISRRSSITSKKKVENF